MSRLKEETGKTPEDSADSSDAASIALARQLQRLFDTEERRSSPRDDVIHLVDDDDDGSSGGWARPRSDPANERKRPFEGKKGGSSSGEKREVTSDEQLARQLQAEEESRHKRQRTESSLSTLSSSSSSLSSSSSASSSWSSALTAVPRHSDSEQAYHELAFYRNYIRGVNNDYAIKLSDVVQVQPCSRHTALTAAAVSLPCTHTSLHLLCRATSPAPSCSTTAGTCPGCSTPSPCSSTCPWSTVWTGRCAEAPRPALPVKQPSSRGPTSACGTPSCPCRTRATTRR